MTINSIYLFLENHGNILRDYYLNNTLTYSNTITDEWVYDSNLNRISFKFKPNSINYFHKSLTENYNESSTHSNFTFQSGFLFEHLVV